MFDSAVVCADAENTAATAMVITDKGVYWHNKEDIGKNFIAWNKMSDYKQSICVKDSDRLVFSQGFGFKAGMAKVDLTALKNAFLKISSFCCNK